MTREPTPFSTGIDSPVSIDSSIALAPETISPSDGDPFARSHDDDGSWLQRLDRQLVLASPSTTRAVGGCSVIR